MELYEELFELYEELFELYEELYGTIRGILEPWNYSNYMKNYSNYMKNYIFLQVFSHILKHLTVYRVAVNKFSAIYGTKLQRRGYTSG